MEEPERCVMEVPRNLPQEEAEEVVELLKVEMV